MPFYSYEAHRDTCAWCPKPLTGRQERFCSQKCRVADLRDRKRRERLKAEGGPKFAACPLCGEQYEVKRGKKFCDYYDEAEITCKTAQDDLEEAAWIAAEERKEATCAHCGKPAGWGGRGRPRKFCSNRCKTAYGRANKSAE
ncbi:hypothetical protein ACFZAG_01770 [Streptomyces sp. NPDC012403]|uniref:hypothetical protein n=1 Tax=Streptomyces sp. NPDC012403 TaxID=3364831 RepID=UPI0036E4DBDC